MKSYLSVLSDNAMDFASAVLTFVSEYSRVKSEGQSFKKYGHAHNVSEAKRLYDKFIGELTRRGAKLSEDEFVTVEDFLREQFEKSDQYDPKMVEYRFPQAINIGIEASKRAGRFNQSTEPSYDDVVPL